MRQSRGVISWMVLVGIVVGGLLGSNLIGCSSKGSKTPKGTGGSVAGGPGGTYASDGGSDGLPSASDGNPGDSSSAGGASTGGVPATGGTIATVGTGGSTGSSLSLASGGRNGTGGTGSGTVANGGTGTTGPSGGTGGNGGGGHSGLAGTAGSATGPRSGGVSGTADLSATGGVYGAGGLSGSGTGGSSGTGGAEDTSEYTACESSGDTTKETIYRIDRVNSVCTIFAFSQTTKGCSLGLTNNGWCLGGVSQTADLANCASDHVITGTMVSATGATGTFTVSSGSPPLINLDLTVQFPKSSGLLQTVQARVTSCKANCTTTDCRQ